MIRSLEVAKRHGLLEGYRVHVTKNVRPKAEHMKGKIIWLKNVSWFSMLNQVGSWEVNGRTQKKCMIFECFPNFQSISIYYIWYIIIYRVCIIWISWANLEGQPVFPACPPPHQLCHWYFLCINPFPPRGSPLTSNIVWC